MHEGYFWQMKKYPLFLLPVLFLLSCGQDKDSNNVNAGSIADTAAEKKDVSFVPVTSILQNQLAILDSLPVTILQVKTINKKEDSTWLPAAQVKPLLSAFFSPAIDKKNMTGLFKESRFDDQSTAAITFTYDPKTTLPDSLTLRHWDVYFDPEINAIRRIYLLKTVKENNVPVTQQLTWQMDKWAKIVTIRNDANTASPMVTETKWVWDLNE
jgi:hypothetical protein